jgi:hypothetical protein
MQMTASERWETSDHDVQLTFNFTDIRAIIEFKMPRLNNMIIENKNLTTKLPTDYVTGDNIVYNDTLTR